MPNTNIVLESIYLARKRLIKNKDDCFLTLDLSQRERDTHLGAQCVSSHGQTKSYSNPSNIDKLVKKKRKKLSMENKQVLYGQLPGKYFSLQRPYR